MKTLFSQLRSAAVNRARYHRTLSALNDLSRDSRRDLALDSADLRHVARRAVYGA